MGTRTRNRRSAGCPSRPGRCLTGGRRSPLPRPGNPRIKGCNARSANQKYLSRPRGPSVLAMLPIPLDLNSGTLQALAILAVALGIAGIAILLLFAKDKI